MAKFHFFVVCSLLAVLFHSKLGSAAVTCDEDPCLNRGSCTSLTNATGYQCTCQNGYTGTNCEVDPCANTPCLNGGTCQVRDDSEVGYICFCKKNFFEMNCERDANACRSTPCLHRGDCRNRPATGSYVCRCLLGTSGDQCQINDDDCASSPCQNNGTCTDRIGGFICLCPKGIVGHLCEMDYSSQIEVTCDPNEMTITLVPSLLPDEYDLRSVHLDNETCSGALEDSKIKLSTPYEDCGTMVEDTGDTIIFSNTILHTKNVITSHDLLKLPVECIMRKKETLYGGSYTAERRETLRTAFKGYGRFEVTLKRYTSYLLDVVATSENIHNEDLLIYAASLKSSANLTVLLDNCWTTPGEEPNDILRYDLIVDGCPDDVYTTIWDDADPLKQGFAFPPFFFVGYVKVHVHCDVTVCVTDSSGCRQRCNANPVPRLRRSLREAPSLSMTNNAISSGPLTFNYDV